MFSSSGAIAPLANIVSEYVNCTTILNYLFGLVPSLSLSILIVCHNHVSKQKDIDDQDSQQSALHIAQIETSLVDCPVVGTQGQDQKKHSKYQQLGDSTKSYAHKKSDGKIGRDYLPALLEEDPVLDFWVWTVSLDLVSFFGAALVLSFLTGAGLATLLTTFFKGD